MVMRSNSNLRGNSNNPYDEMNRISINQTPVKFPQQETSYGNNIWPLPSH